MASQGTVQLHRDGFESVEILVSQLTPATVASTFNLDATTVWLKEEFGPKAFFPDPTNSTFQLTTDVGRGIVTFSVRGSPRTTSTPASWSQHVVSPNTHNTSLFKPVFSGKKGAASINVKVIQAQVSRTPSGKLEFHKLGQAFIDINENTANVYFISSVVQKKWGEDYVIVTADGLRVEDSSGTQGLKFWKVGSRKIFAVEEAELKCVLKGKRKRKLISTSFESEEDDDEDSGVIPSPKNKQLDTLITMTKSIQYDLKAVLGVKKDSKLPPGLYVKLKETFMCRICRSTPIVPPIIITRCCKSILGCEQCVDSWYSGDEGRKRTCPLCRASRACSEVARLHGLEEFLDTIRPLIYVDDNPGPSGSGTQFVPSPPAELGDDFD